MQYEYVNQNCPHCHAPHGHYITCPVFNRAIAEKKSMDANQANEKKISEYVPDQNDILRLKGMGVIW